MCDPKPVFILLIAALVPAFTMRDALAADRTPAEQSVAPFRLPDRITTLDGKTYEKVVLDKVEPDGLLVFFSPLEGGSGTAKLKFRNLPAELREPYGYDADEAADHEAAQARGEAAWRAEHAVWMEQKVAARAEQAARDKQILAERAEAERAQAEAARYAQEQAVSFYPEWSYGGGYGYGGYGPACYGSGSHRGGSRFKNHVHCPKPVVGQRPSHISPFMKPMGWSGNTSRSFASGRR